MRDLRTIAALMLARRAEDVPLPVPHSIGAAIEELREVLDEPRALRELAEELVLRWHGPPSLASTAACPGSLAALFEELREALEAEKEHAA